MSNATWKKNNKKNVGQITRPCLSFDSLSLASAGLFHLVCEPNAGQHVGAVGLAGGFREELTIGCWMCTSLNVFFSSVAKKCKARTCTCTKKITSSTAFYKRLLHPRRSTPNTTFLSRAHRQCTDGEPSVRNLSSAARAHMDQDHLYQMILVHVQSPHPSH